MEFNHGMCGKHTIMGMWRKLVIWYENVMVSKPITWRAKLALSKCYHDFLLSFSCFFSKEGSLWNDPLIFLCFLFHFIISKPTQSLQIHSFTYTTTIHKWKQMMRDFINSKRKWISNPLLYREVTVVIGGKWIQLLHCKKKAIELLNILIMVITKLILRHGNWYLSFGFWYN